jgi:hypothetical protein
MDAKLSDVLAVVATLDANVELKVDIRMRAHVVIDQARDVKEDSRWFTEDARKCEMMVMISRVINVRVKSCKFTSARILAASYFVRLDASVTHVLHICKQSIDISVAMSAVKVKVSPLLGPFKVFQPIWSELTVLGKIFMFNANVRIACEILHDVLKCKFFSKKLSDVCEAVEALEEEEKSYNVLDVYIFLLDLKLNTIKFL